MMTKQRKMRLQRKIQESRGRLMENHPFFALLLMYLKFVAVPEMKKISTNGRCIYFSPEFLDKLHSYELDYVLCHQIMHIIYGHIWRPYDLAGEDYHFACDIQINAIFAKSGFLRNSYTHLGYVYSTIPGVPKDVLKMAPEEIQAWLPFSLNLLDERTRNRYLSDSDCWWDQKEEAGIAGELILDVPELDGRLKEGSPNCTSEESDDSEELQGVWKSRAASAVQSMSLSASEESIIGDVPEFMMRMLAKMKSPTVDWKRILNNFIQEQVCDYSFSPPDRRFADTGFFLPDFNEKDFISKEILFMADTSGSVKDEEIAVVYSEIRGAIEQFGGKLTGKLGFFDAVVIPPLPFECVSELMRIIPYGGGGTNFRVIFDYIRSNCGEELPSCVVIFTDGRGPYPLERETMGIPVLWMINNDEITPPWGRVVHLI